MRFGAFRGLDDVTDRLRSTRRTRSGPLRTCRIGDACHVSLDRPGVKPDPFEVTVDKDVPNVKTLRQWKTAGVGTVACERPVGTCTRELLVGESLDTARIATSCEDGVLRLAGPRSAPPEARHMAMSASKRRTTEAVTTAGAR